MNDGGSHLKKSNLDVKWYCPSPSFLIWTRLLARWVKSRSLVTVMDNRCRRCAGLVIAACLAVREYRVLDWGQRVELWLLDAVERWWAKAA